MSNGFRWGCIYGSYSTNEDSILGFAIMIANFNFAIGIILREH